MTASSVVPSPGERTDPTGLNGNSTQPRSRTEVEGLYSEVLAIRCSLAHDRRASDDMYVRRINGITAAVAWILNKTLLSPVTEASSSMNGWDSTPTAIANELSAAHDRLSIGPADGDYAYVEGASEALSWALNQQANKPC